MIVEQSLTHRRSICHHVDGAQNLAYSSTINIRRIVRMRCTAQPYDEGNLTHPIAHELFQTGQLFNVSTRKKTTPP